MSRRNSPEEKARRRTVRAARSTKEGEVVPGDGSVYEMARTACGVVLRISGRAALASELAANGTNDEEIAMAYAAGMQPSHQKDAYKGAMAALRDHSATACHHGGASLRPCSTHFT